MDGRARRRSRRRRSQSWRPAAHTGHLPMVRGTSDRKRVGPASMARCMLAAKCDGERAAVAQQYAAHIGWRSREAGERPIRRAICGRSAEGKVRRSVRRVRDVALSEERSERRAACPLPRAMRLYETADAAHERECVPPDTARGSAGALLSVRRTPPRGRSTEAARAVFGGGRRVNRPIQRSAHTPWGSPWPLESPHSPAAPELATGAIRCARTGERPRPEAREQAGS